MTDAQQAQLAGLLVELARKGARLFPLGDVGLDLLLDEAPRRGTGHLVRLVEVGGVRGIGHEGLRCGGLNAVQKQTRSPFGMDSVVKSPCRDHQ